MDDYKRIILYVEKSDNPIDFNEVIPQIKQIEENIEKLPEKHSNISRQQI
jgi:hypothetical protein